MLSRIALYGPLDSTLKRRGSEQMDEEKFNISIRKFLKLVGIAAQREIEKAVREASSAGRLQSNESLRAKMTLEIQALELSHTVEGDIELS